MLDAFLFLLALVVLWFGAGISISGVDKVSRFLKISSFIASFIILGTLTSVSEISVAYFSILNKTPSISLGNLLGASIILTQLAVPLLAVLNKGIKIDDRTEPINFNVAYLTISLPALLILDRSINLFDVGIMLVAFIFLGVTVSTRNSILNKFGDAIIHPKVNLVKETIKILVGVLLIVLSSKFIVDMAIKYSNILAVSPFLVGVLILSIGTNLPEVTVLIRSTLAKKKTIALGDYVGSAVFNTLILCALIVFNGSPITLNSGLKLNVLLLPLGSLAFLYLTRDGRLERKEGMFLMLFYFVFVLWELFL